MTKSTLAADVKPEHLSAKASPSESSLVEQSPYREGNNLLLKFSVSNFFMLGSPVAVFLMIRNQRNPLPEHFYLMGCQRVFNIFHPYDPVAYRIEPCMDPRHSNIDPCIIMHWNGGYRVQYRTRRMWRRIVDNTKRTQRDLIGAFEDRMTKIGLLGNPSVSNNNAESEIETSDDSASEISSDDVIIKQSAMQNGTLNRGMRIDYMLQEKEIENANEYVAALAAHSRYWSERDLSLFISVQINAKTGE